MALGKLNTFNKREFIELAKKLASQQRHEIDANLKRFLEFAYDYPIVLNTKGGVALATARTISDVETYLNALLKEYFKKLDSRVSLKEVATTPDPAVDVVLESFAGVKKGELPTYSKYHRLSMAAENKIGELLERYIAEQLVEEGWFWCCCNVMTGVDFLLPGDPVVLLQVKNRSNSENSSSEKIRDLLEARGCPVRIRKWHRCNSKDGSTCWNELPGNTNEELANEDGFREFLRDYTKD